jgi:ribosomal-protein-alanine N-acetyltransferase
MPPLPLLREPLDDGVIALRDFAERDIPEILIAYEDDRDLHERMGLERPPSGAQLGRRAETEAADRLAGAYATLTVLEAGSDLCRGQVNVHGVDWDHARAELGLWIAPERRGRGLGRRALVLAARWLIEECAIERVQVLTETDNHAMLAIARAAGFSYEGVLRGYHRLGGRRDDAAILSLLVGELPPR